MDYRNVHDRMSRPGNAASSIVDAYHVACGTVPVQSPFEDQSSFKEICLADATTSTSNTVLRMHSSRTYNAITNQASTSQDRDLVQLEKRMTRERQTTLDWALEFARSAFRYVWSGPEWLATCVQPILSNVTKKISERVHRPKSADAMLPVSERTPMKKKGNRGNNRSLHNQNAMPHILEAVTTVYSNNRLVR